MEKKKKKNTKTKPKSHERKIPQKNQNPNQAKPPTKIPGKFKLKYREWLQCFS